ncbi:MAG: hypothetical protein M1838_002598 [Thelocarpon superellum]|nr:MAG: hypothetical protein M1838_002598 [Thelocarpon superellum]
MATQSPSPVFRPQVILITGASRGLGHSIASSLIASGHRVVLVSRTAAPLEALQASHPGQVHYLTGDVQQRHLAKEAVQLALETWGRLDGLVVNHGQLAPVARLVDADIEAWEAAYRVNVFGCLDLIKHAIPALRTSHGRIILTSSGAARTGYGAWGAYGSSKAALNHIALTLATEEPLVTAVAVRPGTVDTEMQRELRDEHLHKLDEAVATRFRTLKEHGKLLDPAVVGAVVARLVVGVSRDCSGRYLE